MTTTPTEIAHAGGSHEHSGDLQPDPDGKWNLNGVRHGFRRLPSLYPWPEDDAMLKPTVTSASHVIKTRPADTTIG